MMMKKKKRSSAGDGSHPQPEDGQAHPEEVRKRPAAAVATVRDRPAKAVATAKYAHRSTGRPTDMATTK